jgi:hypothetical protein
VVTFPVATQQDPNAHVISVNCPTSTPRVVGGGYSYGEQFQGAAVVLQNRPQVTTGTAWTVSIRNNGSTFPITAGIYAVCVK